MNWKRECWRRAAYLLVIPAISILAAQTQAKKEAPKASATPGKPKAMFKAIWEPVNVPYDLELRSVRFTSPQEGWVAGGKGALSGGVILHTSDGGGSWQVQIGDSESSDRSYNDLRFLTPTLGWASQSTPGGDHRLLRTTDGKAWEPAGTLAQHRADYRFVSRDVGFVISGDTVLRTTAGGRTWDPVYHCKVRAEIQGLTREVPCEFSQMYFVNPQLGFAISQAIARDGGIVFAKTEDGGVTWNASVVLPGQNGKEGAIHFFDANTGVIRMLDGKLFRTVDGGKTWHEASGIVEGKPNIEFADPQVGWMIRYRTMTYTTDGGQSWTSRAIQFPAAVEAFSLVQRDCGYAVGDHGMVYRYRVVPMEYTARGILGAPSMPAR